MITHKEIEDIYRVSPFNEESIEEALACGLDLEDIGNWAVDVVVPNALEAIEEFDFDADVLSGIWVSAFRIGFFLGRGYVE